MAIVKVTPHTFFRMSFKKAINSVEPGDRRHVITKLGRSLS